MDLVVIRTQEEVESVGLFEISQRENGSGEWSEGREHCHVRSRGQEVGC